MSQSVRIVIKNPTQPTDFRLEATLDSTVLDLKTKLSQQYVNNPAPSSQKLIFAGRLLQDEAILSDILRQHDITIPQTFHLVVRPAQAPAPPAPQPTPNTNNANNNNDFQQQPNFPQQGMPPGMQFFPFGAPPPQNLTPEQQVAYMQYAYQQYAAAAAAAAAAGYPGAVPPGFRPYGYNPYYQGAQPGMPPQPGQPQPAQHQQPPNIPPRAPQAAGDGGHNMSLLLKLAFLVFILSSGGGNERIFLLAVGAVIVFLYQTGRIHIPRVRVVHINAHAPPAPAPNGNNPQAAPGQPQAQEQQPQQQQQQQHGFLGELGLIVSSFIFSLFPTWQAQPQGGAPQPPPQVPQPPPENNF